MTEERNVDGKAYYFTAEGAKAFDALKEGGWEAVGSKDPGFSLFGGATPLGPKGEQHQGKV